MSPLRSAGRLLPRRLFDACHIEHVAIRPRRRCAVPQAHRKSHSCDLRPDPNPKLSDKVTVVTLTVTVDSDGRKWLSRHASGLVCRLTRRIRAPGAPDSAFAKSSRQKPTNLAQARTLPIVIELGKDENVDTDFEDGIAS